MCGQRFFLCYVHWQGVHIGLPAIYQCSNLFHSLKNRAWRIAAGNRYALATYGMRPVRAIVQQIRSLANAQSWKMRQRQQARNTERGRLDRGEHMSLDDLSAQRRMVHDAFFALARQLDRTARSCGLPSIKQLFSTLQQTRKTPHARTCAVQQGCRVTNALLYSILGPTMLRMPTMLSCGNDMSARHSYIMLVRENHNMTIALAPVHTDFLMSAQQYFC